MTAEKLEPGWYWVKWHALDAKWVPAECQIDRQPYWWSAYEGRPYLDGRQPAIIGPRLTPPEGSS